MVVYKNVLGNQKKRFIVSLFFYETSVFVKSIQTPTSLSQIYHFYKNHSAAFVLRRKNDKRISQNLSYEPR